MESLHDYLTQLASENPTPGGGSAATIVAASGAALVAMVARICLGSSKYASRSDEIEALIREADELREGLERARPADEAAYAAVVAASALPKTTEAEQTARRTALEAALAGAAEAPLHAARLCVEVLQLAQRAVALENRHLVSDLGCAAQFAHAGLVASAYNVRINHRFMKDAVTVETQTHRLDHLEREGAALFDAVRHAVAAAL